MKKNILVFERDNEGFYWGGNGHSIGIATANNYGEHLESRICLMRRHGFFIINKRLLRRVIAEKYRNMVECSMDILKIAETQYNTINKKGGKTWKRQYK